MPSRVEDALVAIRRIMRAAEQSSRSLSRQAGMTASQVVVLQIIAAEGEISPSAIAQKARITQATVTALLDRLQKRALVTRTQGAADRRRVFVTLTEAGRKLLDDTPDALQTRFAARFNELKDWQQASINAALEQVAELLDAEKIEAAPILAYGRLDPTVDDHGNPIEPQPPES